jgi:superfamily II DNA helicase RecQ
MARRIPDTPAAFLAVHGVGEKKLAQYGDRFLALIARHRKAAAAGGGG